LRPDPTGGSARLDCPNSPKNFSDAPKGISHALHRVDTDGLGARKRGGRSSFGAGGRRGAAGGLARLLQGWKRMSFQNTSTKEANHEAGRPDHDLTQHSVTRRRTSGSEVVPGWKGPFREGPNRSGTATDYGLRMLCDGHGCWRRASPPALAIAPTKEAGLSGRTL
jgi:hypothetical protein